MAEVVAVVAFILAIVFLLAALRRRAKMARDEDISDDGLKRA
jgi:hypothetical protein